MKIIYSTDYSVSETDMSLREPTKILGEPGKQAKMFIFKLPDGKQINRIEIQAGFSWTDYIKPVLPGCPDWCPATHFGYLESGKMIVKIKNECTISVESGDAYLIEPGHVPIIEEDTVMIEFTQDTTYTNKDFVKK